MRKTSYFYRIFSSNRKLRIFIASHSKHVRYFSCSHFAKESAAKLDFAFCFFDSIAPSLS